MLFHSGLTGVGLPLYSAGFARLVSGPPKAPVAELVDALDSKSSSARSAGSIPARGTILRSHPALRVGDNRDPPLKCGPAGSILLLPATGEAHYLQ
jgi:hypothetical protein